MFVLGAARVGNKYRGGLGDSEARRRRPDLAVGPCPPRPHSPTVGEEDEVSIQEAAEAVVEAMDFHGEVTVSFGSDAPKMALPLAAGEEGWCSVPKAPPGKGRRGSRAGWGRITPSAVALTRHLV